MIICEGYQLSASGGGRLYSPWESTAWLGTSPLAWASWYCVCLEEAGGVTSWHSLGQGYGKLLLESKVDTERYQSPSSSLWCAGFVFFRILSKLFELEINHRFHEFIDGYLELGEEQSPLIWLHGSKGNPCHGSIHTLQSPLCRSPLRSKQDNASLWVSWWPFLS